MTKVLGQHELKPMPDPSDEYMNTLGSIIIFLLADSAIYYIQRFF